MKSLLKDLGIKIVILSRSRFDTITTHKLLPSFIEVLVPESQREQYESRLDNPVITTPDNVKGLGMLRNWCIDNFKEQTVIMLDDDISKCYCLTGYRTKAIKDKDEVLEIIVNAAIMANDLGVGCFGFSQTDIRKYNATQPFDLCTWVGGIIGVIGKGIRFRNDKFKVDIDFVLQNLLTKRIVWQDTRYYFFQQRDNNAGGNSDFRTKESYIESTKSLKAKWGSYIKISDKHASNLKITLNVKRRQSIKL